jgi:Ankyrin repeats (3 copies)
MEYINTAPYPASFEASRTMNELQFHVANGEIFRVIGTDRAAVDPDEALLEAAGRGLWETVTDLFRSGPFNGVPIDINATNENKQTALHLAVNKYGMWKPFRSRYYATIELLLGEKANPNAQDSSGKTPVHYAAASGSDNLLELLLNDGRVEIIRDSNGDTPLHCAVHDGPWLYAINLLIGVYMKQGKYRTFAEVLLGAYETYRDDSKLRDEFQKYLEYFLLDVKRNAEVVSGHANCGCCGGITQTQQTALAAPPLPSKDAHEMSNREYTARLRWAVTAQDTIDQLKMKCERLRRRCDEPGLMSKATTREYYC